MTEWTEEDLIVTLGGVLLKDDIDGLDEDLVAYISGLLSIQLQDATEESCEEILEESMIPFLDSVSCPADIQQEAKEAIISQAKKAADTATQATSSEAPKLTQGIVNMSSTLTNQSEEEANRYLWGPGENIKSKANTQVDALYSNTSAKDKRKHRQDLEKSRESLSHQNELEQTSTKAGVSAMLLPTVKSKDKDILLQNITLALDSGTQLLEQGDLKFAYRRRYGLIGENGVGKSEFIAL
jgi:ABC-type multidrug transport system fused ATPase/permease subunit